MFVFGALIVIIGLLALAAPQFLAIVIGRAHIEDHVMRFSELQGGENRISTTRNRKIWQMF